MRIAWGLVVVVGIAAGCGGKPPVPKRGVVESDLGGWKFRRFQGPLLDVEVWVDGNKGEAFTASYVTDDAEKRGRVTDRDIVNVFVTRYEKDDGIVRETVKLAKRLASEKGYRVDEGKVGKTRALSIIGDGEAWVMWPSKGYVVKVGGRGLQVVPETMIAKYADRFPSQLPGGALEGALPSANGEVKKVEKFEYDPSAPRPDMEKYDPKKVKVPQKDKPVEPDEEPKKKAKKTDDEEPKEKDKDKDKKKVKKADPEDETPKATAKKKIADEEPKKKAKKADADAEDEKPKKKAKKADADAEDEKPKKKAKKSDDEDEEKSAKWKGKSKASDTEDEDEKPKKKKKKAKSDE